MCRPGILLSLISSFPTRATDPYVIAPGNILSKTCISTDFTAITRREINVVLMLAQRLRRCSSIKTALTPRLVFAGFSWNPPPYRIELFIALIADGVIKAYLSQNRCSLNQKSGDKTIRFLSTLVQCCASIIATGQHWTNVVYMLMFTR